MFIYKGLSSFCFALSLAASMFFGLPRLTMAQTPTENSEISSAAVVTKKPMSSTVQPVFDSYHGVKIGMANDEVRAKLNDHLENKGKIQDVFVLAKGETAQVYYDPSGKVMAISIDYVGKGVSAPLPTEVIGESLQPKPDGSMYALKRYPEAGYWVSYNRTAGDDPIVSITMQKLP